MELRARYPDKSLGDLNEMRKALVSNLNLGHIVLHRFGADKTLAFFGEKSSVKSGQLQAIRAFVTARESDAPLDLAMALVQHTKELDDCETRAEMRSAPVPYDATNFGKKGNDLRKPAGDVYEALVGLILLEFEGAVDAVWQLLKKDFFPSEASSEEEERRLAAALGEARTARAKREMAAKAKRQTKLPEAPSAKAAMATPVRAPTVEVVMPEASRALEKRMRSPPDLNEQGTCKRCKMAPEGCICPEVPSAGPSVLPSTGPVVGAAGLADAAVQLAPPQLHVAPLNGKSPITAVNELLAKS
eukprot:1435092-Prymnesium_polylepis.2